MKSKKILVLVIAILAITLPVTVFAANSNSSADKGNRGFLKIDASKLSESQQTDIKEYSKRMADLNKEFINRMVENGTITKEKGDEVLKKIDERIKNGENSQGVFGRGWKKGAKDNCGIFGIDADKLTDKQKSDFADSYKKISELQKNFIKKEVDNGLLSKAQGDTLLDRIDKASKKGNYQNGMGKRVFGGFKRFGIDLSKLSDKQKADITEYMNSMAALKKELINKAVANGAITKIQGDAAIQRIENRMKKGLNFSKEIEKR